MIRDIDVSEGLIGGGFPCTEPVGCRGMPWDADSKCH